MIVTQALIGSEGGLWVLLIVEMIRAASPLPVTSAE
jgi:hypothetical protein